jgi:hypothetical protein
MAWLKLILICVRENPLYVYLAFAMLLAFAVLVAALLSTV